MALGAFGRTPTGLMASPGGALPRAAFIAACPVYLPSRAADGIAALPPYPLADSRASSGRMCFPARVCGAGCCERDESPLYLQGIQSHRGSRRSSNRCSDLFRRRKRLALLRPFSP